MPSSGKSYFLSTLLLYRERQREKEHRSKSWLDSVWIFWVSFTCLSWNVVRSEALGILEICSKDLSSAVLCTVVSHSWVPQHMSSIPVANEVPALAVGQQVGPLLAVGLCVNPEASGCWEGRRLHIMQGQKEPHVWKL